MEAPGNACEPTAPSNQLPPNTNDERSCSDSLLLFSLQFFLNSVELRSPEPPSKKCVRKSDSARGGFLIGFQLLRYEIVLFDTVMLDVDAVRHGDGDEEGDVESSGDVHREEVAQRQQQRRAVLKPQHGKSCLFEADADALVVDLQQERDASLALLIMQQDHGKARLVAFASVPIELHVGLLNAPDINKSGKGDHAALNKEMRFRVCEWASSSGSWELRDHQNRVVGTATGAATLSCLGRTLAPHIVNAIGLQVDKAVSPSSQSRQQSIQDSFSSPLVSSRQPDNDEGEPGRSRKVGFERDTTEDTKLASADKAISNEAGKVVVPVAQKSDMAIQCDEHFLTTEDADGFVSDRTQRSASRSNWMYPAIRIESTKKAHAKSHSSVQHLRQSPPVNSHSPRSYFTDHQHHHFTHKEPRKGPNQQQHSGFEKSVFSRDLPPPLFFQKPQQKKK